MRRKYTVIMDITVAGDVVASSREGALTLFKLRLDNMSEAYNIGMDHSRAGETDDYALVVMPRKPTKEDTDAG